MEREKLLLRQVLGNAGRVQARAKQALIRINVSNPAQNTLIE
jgi:hypothetical protein